MITVGPYGIAIYHDEHFKEGSADNLHQYDQVYLGESSAVLPSMFGIKVFRGSQLLKSALVGSAGGRTTIHENAFVCEPDRLLICCSDTVFCLAVPELALHWRTQADGACCFQIFSYREDYIVHGELEISRLDRNGNIRWQQGGADIFTTMSGGPGFELTDDLIIARDFENRSYKFGYDGANYTDPTQFS